MVAHAPRGREPVAGIVGLHVQVHRQNDASLLFSGTESQTQTVTLSGIISGDVGPVIVTVNAASQDGSNPATFYHCEGFVLH